MAASDTTIATAIGSGLLGLALITTIAMITAYYTVKEKKNPFEKKDKNQSP